MKELKRKKEFLDEKREENAEEEEGGDYEDYDKEMEEPETIQEEKKHTVTKKNKPFDLSKERVADEDENDEEEEEEFEDDEAIEEEGYDEEDNDVPNIPESYDEYN